MSCFTFHELFSWINDKVERGLVGEADVQDILHFQYTRNNSTDPIKAMIYLEFSFANKLCDISLCPDNLSECECELGRYICYLKENMVEIALIDPRGCENDLFLNGKILVLFGLLISIHFNVERVELTDIAKQKVNGEKIYIRQINYQNECEKNEGQFLKKKPSHCLSYYRQFGFKDDDKTYVEQGNCKDDSGDYKRMANGKVMSLRLNTHMCPLFINEIREECVIRLLNIDKNSQQYRDMLDYYINSIKSCNVIDETDDECS